MFKKISQKVLENMIDKVDQLYVDYHKGYQVSTHNFSKNIANDLIFFNYVSHHIYKYEKTIKTRKELNFLKDLNIPEIKVNFIGMEKLEKLYTDSIQRYLLGQPGVQLVTNNQNYPQYWRAFDLSFGPDGIKQLNIIIAIKKQEYYAGYYPHFFVESQKLEQSKKAAKRGMLYLIDKTVHILNNSPIVKINIGENSSITLYGDRIEAILEKNDDFTKKVTEDIELFWKFMLKQPSLSRLSDEYYNLMEGVQERITALALYLS